MQLAQRGSFAAQRVSDEVALARLRPARGNAQGPRLTEQRHNEAVDEVTQIALEKARARESVQRDAARYERRKDEGQKRRLQARRSARQRVAQAAAAGVASAQKLEEHARVREGRAREDAHRASAKRRARQREEESEFNALFSVRSAEANDALPRDVAPASSSCSPTGATLEAYVDARATR
jgi:hypothetical protein